MDKGGLSQCGHFADKERGVNFLRFGAYVLYGRLLIAMTERELETRSVLLANRFEPCWSSVYKYFELRTNILN